MLLLIPGPVTTRPEVRHALTQDFAPWDNDFRQFLTRLRTRILHLAGGIEDQHATLPLQGCGHFIAEAALRTFLPPGGRILIPATGAYADRMIRLAREAGRVPAPLPLGLTDATDPQAVARALDADPTLSHVAMVYSETGSGVIHDVQAVGEVVCAAGRRMIIDAVSAFGALPLDLSTQPEVDAAVFTANKCLEALPGVAFAVGRIDRLLECAGNAGSWSLDLSNIYDHALRAAWEAFGSPRRISFSPRWMSRWTTMTPKGRSLGWHAITPICKPYIKALLIWACRPICHCRDRVPSSSMCMLRTTRPGTCRLSLMR